VEKKTKPGRRIRQKRQKERRCAPLQKKQYSLLGQGTGEERQKESTRSTLKEGKKKVSIRVRNS